MKKRICVFASGNGSNTEVLIKYFNKTDEAKVALVVSNNANARVVSKAKNLGVNTFVFNKAELKSSFVLNKLKELRVDFIILAGFLLLIPNNIIKEYNKRIINVHPSLLPSFGGKGMYGNNVHEAVLRSGVSKSGITIHFVNEQYDDGSILFQKKISIKGQRNVSDLSKMILKLEHHYFPKVIALFCLDKIKWKSNKPELIQEKDFEYEICNN